MVSLMRSVNIHTRVESDQAFELGQKHSFDYAIVPFAGESEINSMKLARRGSEFACKPYILDTNSSIQQNILRSQVKQNPKRLVPKIVL